jgi:hypothetical protein
MTSKEYLNRCEVFLSNASQVVAQIEGICELLGSINEL